MASDIQTRESFIATPLGRLFVKRWRVSGDVAVRAPIVLFHDSLGCVALWRDFPQQLALATGREVIAYDRLGFGQSDPHPGRLAVDFIADEARVGFAQVRAALQLNAFIALGHSVGGGMAIECAAAWPDACRGLITESAQTFVEDRTLAGIREAQQAFAAPEQVERLARYHGDKAAWVLAAWIDSWLSPAFADWCLDASLRAVHCPLLAIHGQHDEYGSPLHPQRIVDMLQGPAELCLLEGIGHVPHRECAPQILTLLQDWLAGRE